MPRVTQVQFAKAVGIAAPQVSELKQKKIIDLTRGMDQSIIDYCKHLREKAGGRSGGGEFDLTEERARLSHHQANMARMDEQVKDGTLIPASIVLTEWQNTAASVRAKLLALPSRLAVTCPGGTTEEIEAKSDELIREVLEELADDPDQ